jgi:hypothetical protein
MIKIIFFMLLGLVSASLYKRENCNKYYMLDESVFYKCQHVNYWTDTVAQAKIQNRTYRFDPFSPFKIWLNASGVPIGMSSSDRYVFVVNDGKINSTERMSWSLNRLLKSEVQKDDTYRKPEGFDDDDEDEDEYEVEEENFMTSYIMTHPFNHTKWTEIMKQYYLNPLTTPQPDIDPEILDSLIQQLEDESPSFKDFIVSCTMSNGDVRITRVDMKVDLSDQDGLDVEHCEIDVKATHHEWGWTPQYISEGGD